MDHENDCSCSLKLCYLEDSHFNVAFLSLVDWRCDVCPWASTISNCEDEWKEVLMNQYSLADAMTDK